MMRTTCPWDLSQPLLGLFIVCLLSVMASAGPLTVSAGTSLKITADGDTFLEAALPSEGDVAKLKSWLSSSPDAEKIAASGSSVVCGPVTLRITPEISERWNSTPEVLAQRFADKLRDRLSPPLSWGRTEQVIPLGESREIAMKLPSGVNLSVTTSDPSVVKVENLGPGRYRLTSLARGSTFLSVDASNGKKVPALPVHVRPWAARWESGPGRLEFTGPTDVKRVKTSLERWLSARALPGAVVSAQPKGKTDGPTWTFQASASAPGAIAVEQTLQVEIVGLPSRALAPAEVVMLSNHPEKIFGEGTLYQRKTSAASYRLMWHHRNDPDGVERYLTVTLTNPNPSPRKFRVVWSSYGPSPDEIHVGHTAALTYATAGMAGDSEFLTLPANSSRVIEVRRVKIGQTVSGVACLWDESGAKLPLQVTVSSSLPLEAAPNVTVESRDPGRTASGVFPAQIEKDATHTLGGPFTFIDYGGEPYVKDLEGGHPSYGNFATMYRTRLMLHNPSDSTRQAYVGFSAPGGAARGVLLFDGTLYDLPMGRSGDGVPVANLTLAAGETRQVDVELFPQAGSNYPIRLIVRSDFERREKEELPPTAPHRWLIP